MKFLSANLCYCLIKEHMRKREVDPVKNDFVTCKDITDRMAKMQTAWTKDKEQEKIIIRNTSSGKSVIQ